MEKYFIQRRRWCERKFVTYYPSPPRKNKTKSVGHLQSPFALRIIRKKIENKILHGEIQLKTRNFVLFY